MPSPPPAPSPGSYPTSTAAVALVTGCSSGIGLDLVEPLVAEGYTVVATMRRAAERAGVLGDAVQRHPDRIVVLELDVTDGAARHAVLETIRERWGRLDLLVNNAGFGVFGALENLTEQEIRQQIEVNVISVIMLVQESLPLLRRSSGRIITISSVLGITGLPLTSLYCLSKFAVEGLGEALYHELAPYGVQICNIEPGGHRTQFGRNICWGTRALDDPLPYTEETKRYREDMRGRIGERAVPSSNVVRAIIGVLRRRRMPLRVPCGADSRGAILAKKLLPAPLFLWIASVGARYAYYRRTGTGR